MLRLIIFIFIAESRIVAAVMMSNTILDAAKTSRMLLIMQTQTNLIDLTQLAEGLLIDDDAMVRIMFFVLTKTYMELTIISFNRNHLRHP